jgi:heavy metal sensor kinase
MTILNRVTLRLGGILLISLVWMAGVIHYEWAEQQRRFQQERTTESAWEESGEVVLFYGTPTVLLLLIGGWWLLRRSLAPIDTLTRGVERIHIHSLKERLPVSGRGDELDRLTVVFNSMMTRLEESFTQIREFTLHASHELKTPLTVMRAELETALREPQIPLDHRELFASQLEEIARLTRIVDSLALLAKADAGHLTVTFERVQLDVLVRDSFADAQMLAQPSGLRVELQACDEIPVRGDRHRLRQLLLNLTDNSIKYNQPGGLVTIALRRRADDAELTIANTGPGIPAERQPYVFNRFYRGDAAHNTAVEGSGLGLSIAQSIVEAHGGTIQIDSVPNHLTTVTVTLPLHDGSHQSSSRDERP